MLEIVLVIGLPLSAAASLMAYIITLQEYSHHFVDKSNATKQAFEAALSTFIFFVLMTVALGLLLKRWL
jgi:ABC-type amino acid transport system permease subunit